MRLTLVATAPSLSPLPDAQGFEPLSQACAALRALLASLPSAKPDRSALGVARESVSRAARGAVRRIVGAPHGAYGCHGVPPFL